MPLTDMGIDEARNYRPVVPEPDGFDSFWTETLDEHADVPLDLTAAPFDNRQALIDTWDLSWAGYHGSRVSGWLHAPAGANGPLPLVIEYLGYSGSRGVPIGSAFAAAGYAHIVVDPRGQGWGHPALTENSPDVHEGSGAPGFMTQSLSDPHGHYYRRLFTDAFRCLQTAREMEIVDPTRIVVHGHSQGAGQTIAVCGLAAMRGIKLAGAFVDAPFLCHMRRSCDIATAGPYLEVVKYLAAHPSLCGKAFQTLGYFDGLHFARRARTATWFSVAMMDQLVPPSSVWAAYNAWGDGMVADKQIAVYPFAGHSAGEDVQRWNQLGVLALLLNLCSALDSDDEVAVDRRVDAVAELTPRVVIEGSQASAGQDRHKILTGQTKGVPRHSQRTAVAQLASPHRNGLAQQVSGGATSRRPTVGSVHDAVRGVGDDGVEGLASP